MRRSRPLAFLASVAVTPLAAMAIAACGGGGAATAAPVPTPSESTTAASNSATIRVANSRLGRILVDSTGRTLYLFKADVRTSSACSGACATAWPPLLADGKPTAGTGLTASKLGTTTRSDGTRQVTYNGHPLYLFIKDQSPAKQPAKASRHSAPPGTCSRPQATRSPHSNPAPAATPAPAAAMGTSPSARAPHDRCPPASEVSGADLSGSALKRLDPEVLGEHLGRLLRAASALCGSRESAEDLVQETAAQGALTAAIRARGQ